MRSFWSCARLFMMTPEKGKKLDFEYFAQRLNASDSYLKELVRSFKKSNEAL